MGVSLAGWCTRFSQRLSPLAKPTSGDCRSTGCFARLRRGDCCHYAICQRQSGFWSFGRGINGHDGRCRFLAARQPTSDWALCDWDWGCNGLYHWSSDQCSASG
ncbi:Uncharacterised protein [Vibrio cholerae]|nr:Uncharacterised protein [Vibrio cholerae]